MKGEEEGESMDKNESERKELQIVQLCPISNNTSSRSNRQKNGRLPFPLSTLHFFY
jgi:hypothetical protein